MVTAREVTARETTVPQGLTLRERIVRSAQDLFFERGYFPTTTREIARRAGTSESGVFRMFRDKYDVLMAVYDRCWGEVNAAIDHKVPVRAKEPREAILGVLRVLWQLYAKQPQLMAFIIINTGNTDTLLLERHEHAIITAENLRYVGRIEGLANDCVKNGMVPGVTARALSEGILGISEGVLLGWYLADKPASSRQAYPKKISVEDALQLVRRLLYGSATTRKKRRTKS